MPIPSAAAVPYGGTPNKLRNLVSPRLFHTGTQAAVASADFNNTTVGASTELRVAECYVDAPIASTGAALFNATTVGTDTTRICLYDVNGQIIASTAGALTSGADAYQRFAWALEFRTSATTGTAVTVPITLDPGTYFLGHIQSGTTATVQTFVVGNFGAVMLVAVYATAGISTSLTIAPPTTFTTLQGPVISLY